MVDIGKYKDNKLCEGEILSVSFTSNFPVPKPVPGTQQALRKYLLNERWRYNHCLSDAHTRGEEDI